ncbi:MULTISPECIES: aspartate/glutamate racemase family protein [unclassified Saccharopolyspora]|uniref:aspartate/glutamate racemase family protein n=1 Tax=unclassified Saccharopolyspora TaxID=2646250 RepID=UPI001CD2072E|nr:MULTISPECIES: aspartate/glutamate racemase family protein [unclassified Saccharopolyspora]MCA1186932.1 aspartate/glutamate racemase family protein [Saccharopolyspora sp. 6T]MCA1192689.1 aspartate/glutamate racemase family protein [Saccharopolyspora sp. 6V]MCA1228778.1 aspartate/glutamate racemase family protein [Saccharopolyspora sp. 6M]MCA1280479.1 aspartate/glutamate racemase family protein [Saccharopolyspora sp. 7B]
MLVHAVTPIVVGPREVARRQARYDALSPAGVRVVLSDLPSGGPRALESAADVRRSTELVAESLAAAPECDAVLPDCVLDPAVPADGGLLGGRPALGLLRLAVGAAVAAGHRIGAVTRNAAIAAELRHRIDDYGWSNSFAEVAVLDLAVEDITDPARWSAAMRDPLAAFAAAGVTAVINGCSAVDTEQHPDAPVVLDPIRTALAVLGALTPPP